MSNRRQKRQRAIAIWLILSLILSFLIGALAITPGPAGAAETPAAVVDTDGDGIENNQDPEIDGDGLVNGEDDDIDGDGIENFDDVDPIGTNGGEGIDEQKPVRPAGSPNEFWLYSQPVSGIVFLVVAALVPFFVIRRRGKSR